MSEKILPLSPSTSKVSSLCSFLACLGVALGAFGAHALKGRVPDTDLPIWETAVHYHLLHALAALFVSAAVQGIPLEKRVALAKLMLLSLTIFSGSLYLLVLTNTRWLGAITPLGGGGFILSWALLAYEFFKNSDRNARQG
jgi:uncharacterized membrane protein YgdD (TMEM256/DUF423 family)